jgi:N,N'-diacetyllegionaminate synthase
MAEKRKVDYIAEIGKNFIDSTQPKHLSQLIIDAQRMIFRAKQAGATTVKFQTHVFEDEQKKRSERRHAWIAINEESTPMEFWNQIKAFCDSLDIKFLTTPMSKMAAEKVNNLVGRWKVSSADIVDFELLEYLKNTGKPIILSTGMSTPEQVDKAVVFLGDQIDFINYCVSIYPCPVNKINLANLILLSSKYGIPVGFSDHSLSVEVPALAIRMGAVAIEKHFTFDRNDYGPDHKVSLLPEEFKQMVELCKAAENSGESFEQEKEFWNNFRKVG